MSDTTESVRATEPRSKTKRVSWQKPAIFCLCLLPLAWLVVRAVTGDLGANPIEAITRYLGDWALRFILIALAVTPIRVLTGWTTVGRFRRMLGLFAFFYVLLHLLSYVGLDQFFYWSGIWQDIIKRIYITLGMAAVLMLALLAATSTDKMVKRLGAKRWRELHRLVYPAAVLGVIHFFMMLKADYTEPTIYAVILAGLFGIRIYKKWA
ncbi:MAG: sulfite oxidase heme-binding subunit YedZ [Rhodospirillaceae bacterium]|jgi:sulfoxide reductase heme-binding subunit YedZ